jgi:hypothetical protein
MSAHVSVFEEFGPLHDTLSYYLDFQIIQAQVLCGFEELHLLHEILRYFMGFVLIWPVHMIEVIYHLL